MFTNNVKYADQTMQAVADWRESKQEDSRRPHLGGSMIGHHCERYLWGSFRWAFSQQHDSRLLRLFMRGHKEEDFFVEELRGAGLVVLDHDNETGQQFRISHCGGHVSGSLDGKALGVKEAPKTQHLLEFKTHGDKSFKDLKANGVQLSKSQHYAQMQFYMLFTKMKRALYVAVNKNTDELYMERIDFDKAYAQELADKSERIVFADEPVVPPYEKTHYLCKAFKCPMYGNCHENKLPERNCRTCLHSTPESSGVWTCAKHDKAVIPVHAQRKHHDCHRFMPTVVPSKIERYNDVTGDMIYESGWVDDGQVMEYSLTEKETETSSPWGAV